MDGLPHERMVDELRSLVGHGARGSERYGGQGLSGGDERLWLMPEDERWVLQFRRDLGRLERQHRRGESTSEGLARRPRRASPVEPVTAVWISHRYEATPVAAVVGDDLAALDLALRRAAYATQRGWSARIFHDADIRIPTRLGLQVREARAGSLEWLLDIPAWMVMGLSSAPAVALINLVTIVSWREAVRVQLRRTVLTREESRVLEEAARPAPQSEETFADDGSDPPRLAPGNARTGAQRVGGVAVEIPRQGALPTLVERRLDAVEPVVDIDIGDVHVRGVRPETEIVVQQGEQVTSVAIRALRR